MATTNRYLVTGARGQDGLILISKLAAQGHEVLGVVRKQADSDFVKLYEPKAKVICLDLLDKDAVTKMLEEFSPTHIFNLAAESSVGQSWEYASRALENNVVGLANILENIVRLKMLDTRIYQASSSEMFGLAQQSPQDETTPMHPRSPYGVSKVACHHLVVNYRESFGLFTASGILYNHESPLRHKKYVTRKITSNVAAISKGLIDSFELGNIDVSRDWGWAPDYVDGMIAILHAPKPSDYVLASGVSNTLGKFLTEAFSNIGVTNWKEHVKSNPAFFRPAEVIGLLGDSSKARTELGWQPSVNFPQMIKKMVDYDIQALENNIVEDTWKYSDV
jgi:GDPmannose 4,6-dehydratase